jgi:hypothetical protein
MTFQLKYISAIIVCQYFQEIIGHNVHPYYYFQLSDPGSNIIEVTGQYSPKEGEFDE